MIEMKAPVAISPVHNGNQGLVLSAVQSGKGSVEGLMRATGLDRNAVENALRRLRGAKQVLKYGSHYRPASECLLAKVW